MNLLTSLRYLVTLNELAGDVCSVLPGALVGVVRSQGELDALPLVEPEMRTPVGFIYLAKARASPVLDTALARNERWLQHAAQYSGSLKASM